MPTHYHIGPANAADRPAALALAFSYLQEPERSEKVRTALSLVHQGTLDPESIWLASDGIGPCAAILAAPVPGGGAVVWPPWPRTSVANPGPMLDELCRAAIGWLRTRGGRLAQALLTTDVAPAAGPLLRIGFQHITKMLYLRHYLDLSFAELAEPGQLGYVPFPQVAPTVIESTMRQTWIGTHDCPELTDARTPAEALLGHRGDGPHDPDRWWLATLDDDPIGLLLLNQADEEIWDIAYLGVTNDARGQGLGRQLVRKALFEAKAAGMLMVTVSVDERNVPARALYRKGGFESFDERDVLLYLFDK